MRAFMAVAQVPLSGKSTLYHSLFQGERRRNVDADFFF